MEEVDLLNVFVTQDGDVFGTGPILFLPTTPDASLPGHPRSLAWRYFATISLEDALLEQDREKALAALDRFGFYVANRLI